MLRDFFNNIGATQPFATGAAKVGNPYPQQSFYIHGRTVGFGSRAEKLPVGTGFRMTSDSGHSSSEFSRSAKLLVLPKTLFGLEQFHAPRRPNNATRLSGMEWHWPAKRA